MWASLTTGDKQTALDNLSWLQDIDSLPKERLRLFQMLESALSGDSLKGYETALSALYGKDTLKEAQQCLDGALPFHGIPSPTEDDFHQSLIQAYDKAWQQRQKSA